MSTRSKAGKAQWQARQGRYAQDLTDQITRRASVRMDAWAARGHIPLLIRAKAFTRGHAMHLPTKDAGR
jgi:uncharacterized protein YeaO (DUF488 family)